MLFSIPSFEFCAFFFFNSKNRENHPKLFFFPSPPLSKGIGGAGADAARSWRGAVFAPRPPPLPHQDPSPPRARRGYLSPVQPGFSAPGSRTAESNMAGAATTPGLTPLLPRMGRDFSLPPPNVARQNARRPRLLFAPFPPPGGLGGAGGGGKVVGRTQCRARCLFCINMAVALASDRDKPCALRPSVPAKQLCFFSRRFQTPPIPSPLPPPLFPCPGRCLRRGCARGGAPHRLFPAPRRPCCGH